MQPRMRRVARFEVWATSLTLGDERVRELERFVPLADSRSTLDDEVSAKQRALASPNGPRAERFRVMRLGSREVAMIER